MGWLKVALFTLALCAACVAVDHAALVLLPKWCRARRQARAVDVTPSGNPLRSVTAEGRDPDDESPRKPQRRAA